jgi:hypothetical protein
MRDFAVSELTFGIALMSKRVAADWPSVESLLAATLRSVFNQSVQVRVIIACHEAPRIDEARDRRVTIQEVGFDIPRFRWEMEIDRMRKAEVVGRSAEGSRRWVDVSLGRRRPCIAGARQDGSRERREGGRR